jgi:hypothetical protein
MSTKKKMTKAQRLAMRLRVAKSYRAAHFAAKKACAHLEEKRQEFMRACPAGQNALGVYHIERMTKVPKELALKYYGHWDNVSKQVVDISKLNNLIQLLIDDNKSCQARALYSKVWIHEVGIRKKD